MKCSFVSKNRNTCKFPIIFSFACTLQSLILIGRTLSLVLKTFFFSRQRTGPVKPFIIYGKCVWHDIRAPYFVSNTFKRSKSNFSQNGEVGGGGIASKKKGKTIFFSWKMPISPKKRSKWKKNSWKMQFLTKSSLTLIPHPPAPGVFEGAHVSYSKSRKKFPKFDIHLVFLFSLKFDKSI